jgi:hypothetical protein
MPQDPIPELRELDRRWAAAEVAGDVAALAAIAHEDFRLVGPAGFVLDRERWLDRHRSGDLVTRSLRVDDDAADRVFAQTAVAVGRAAQEAEYRGQPASGEFRLTRVAVHDGGGRRLAALHLSAIAAPAPGRDPR